MITTATADISPVLLLDGKTAQDLMTPKVVSIPGTATVQEGICLLMDRKLNAVPVTNENGDPMGVLSRSDIVGYDRAAYEYLHLPQEADGNASTPLTLSKETRSKIFASEKKGNVLVQDIMTRVIYSVAPETPAKTVIGAMLALGVHRMFVTECGVLLGVISSTDVLRHLQEPLTVSFDQVELLDTSSVN